MKKLVVLAASILLCTLAQAQGADDSGTSAGITIIPRIDYNPVFYDGKFEEATLGNSSLYSLFEGDISDKLSFSICNHWLSTDPKPLYQNTWRSDDVNWCDWAYLEYYPGNFILTAGKQVVTFGGFELEQNDYEIHWDMMSSLYNQFQCYQWGLKAGWMNDAESTGFFLQAVSSPYGEKPFDAMSYSFQYQGYYGPLSLLYSTNMIGNWDGGYEWMFSLGHQLEVGDWTLGVDFTNMVGDPEVLLRRGVSIFGTAKFNPSDHWEFVGRAGFEHAHNQNLDNGIFGVAAHWFPLRNNQNLRIHVAAAHQHLFNMNSLTIGAMYYLNIPRNR